MITISSKQTQKRHPKKNHSIVITVAIATSFSEASIPILELVCVTYPSALHFCLLVYDGNAPDPN
jgi:hypothetical protein